MTNAEAKRELRYMFSPVYAEELINALSEPTIPLSVIEKIKAEIHNEITSGGKWSGGWYEVTEEDAIKKFDEIIDKAVKEYTHE